MTLRQYDMTDFGRPKPAPTRRDQGPGVLPAPLAHAGHLLGALTPALLAIFVVLLLVAGVLLH